MSNCNQLDAWNLLYVARVNVCYWKSIIERHHKRCRLAEFCAAGIGLIASILIFVANSDWTTAVIPAISSFLIAVVGSPLGKLWKPSEPKIGHERWSELTSEVEALWRHGEERGWEEQDITSRTAVLVEREKQYQAHEYLNPQRKVLEKCEAQVHSELTQTYRKEV